MTTHSVSKSPDFSRIATAVSDPVDVTGRKSFLRNVLFTWGGYAFNIAAGFILPRLVSEHLGQTSLGVWDFAWSIVGYLGLIELGLGASVDRFLAYDRAAGDIGNMTRNISSMAVCLNVLGALIVLGSAMVAFFVVPLFTNQLMSATQDSMWIVFFLGLSVASNVFASVYWSALIASHRWDLHNIISAVTSGCSTIAMMISLMLGYGLVAMGIIYSTCVMGGHLVRWRLAYRVCPELRIDWRMAQFQVMVEQTRFAAKNLLPRVAEMLVNQSTSLMLTAFLGPAALAVFSRPRSLTRHVRTIVAKFSAILVPSASAMQAREEHDALREMFLRRCEQAGHLSVSALLWIALLGGPFISVWMGPEYVHEWLVPAVSLGYVATLMQDPLWSIMVGLNKHGSIAVFKLIGATVSGLCVAGALTLSTDKLLAAAIALTLPMLIVDGFVVPFIGCRNIGIRLRDFYFVALLKPLKVFVPAGMCLAAARLLFPDDPSKALLFGLPFGGIVFAICFYLMALPMHFRVRIRKVFMPRSRATLS